MKQGMVNPEPLEPHQRSDLANCIIMLIEDKGFENGVVDGKGYIIYDLGGETIVVFGSKGDLEIQFDRGKVLLFHTRMGTNEHGSNLDLLGCDDIRQEDPDCIPVIERWIDIIYGN